MPRGTQLERHGEGDRVARLVDLVLLLSQYPRQYNRAALAAQYGVTERQITKDLQFLRERLGLAIQRDSSGRGYYLDAVPRLPSLQLDLAQALALLLAAEVGHYVPGVRSQELTAALARLRAILPDQLQDLLERTASTRQPGKSDE
ncbi:MAG: hypothetical protein NZL87_09150, partial [Thermomicrobium sp.]|nr:hypothetical protein [Thermomicrobium sp.]